MSSLHTTLVKILCLTFIMVVTCSKPKQDEKDNNISLNTLDLAEKSLKSTANVDAKIRLCENIIDSLTSVTENPLGEYDMQIEYDILKWERNRLNAFLEKQGCFASSENYSLPNFNNNYDVQDKDCTVIDRASNLMWQRSGSLKEMKFFDAAYLIDTLNCRSYAGYSSRGYAGYHDWRFPTIEEAMTLVEPEKNEYGFYIDSAFDITQSKIWVTSRLPRWLHFIWVVDFSIGDCEFGRSGYLSDPFLYVRAVRTINSHDSTAENLEIKTNNSIPHKSAKQNKIRLRSEPGHFSSVSGIVKKKDVFHPEYNEKGKEFPNQFQFRIINNIELVLDKTSDLMWQQSGSQEIMCLNHAQKYIEDLNNHFYAGYHDWRLPTVEEAMSLMEPFEGPNGMYINPALGGQFRIWTADSHVDTSYSKGLFVDFSGAGKYNNDFFADSCFVRAVRSIKSSDSTANNLEVKTNNSIPYKSIKQKKIILRSEPGRPYGVWGVVTEKNIFHPQYNKDGHDFPNQFQFRIINCIELVLDKTSDLMWQQFGSHDIMDLHDAKKYIESLNSHIYAGYHDWRLPTVEEAMTLMEPIVNLYGNYLNSVFDKEQIRIWTADTDCDTRYSAGLFVDFSGFQHPNYNPDSCYVRAVRSIKFKKQ
jgi:hypothetical protein